LIKKKKKKKKKKPKRNLKTKNKLFVKYV
jgi:hypothetical protein